MTNRFFNDSFNAPFGSLAKSVPLDAQFQLIQAGFAAVAAELDALAGLTTITGLQGFPSSFAGQGLKALRVNAAEAAIQFVRGGAAPIVNVTASRTILETDMGCLLLVNSASAVVLTLPANATTAIDPEATFAVCRYGVGSVTITPAGTVTLRAPEATYTARAQFSVITPVKIGSNEWLLGGDLG